MQKMVKKNNIHNNNKSLLPNLYSICILHTEVPGDPMVNMTDRDMKCTVYHLGFMGSNPGCTWAA